MATDFTKTYSLTVKYTKLDEETIVDSEANVTIFRAKIKRAVGDVVPAQQGVYNAQIVGEVTET